MADRSINIAKLRTSNPNIIVHVYLDYSKEKGLMAFVVKKHLERIGSNIFETTSANLDMGKVILERVSRWHAGKATSWAKNCYKALAGEEGFNDVPPIVNFRAFVKNFLAVRNLALVSVEGQIKVEEPVKMLESTEQ